MRKKIIDTGKRLALLGAMGVLLSAGMAQAQIVTSFTDSNSGVCPSPDNCNLRAAIALGVGSIKNITFAEGLGNRVIPLTQGELSINPVLGSAVTIDGGPGGVTIDADGLSRVFAIAGGTVTLKNLTIRSGASGPGLNGGGIYNRAILTLQNCTMINNTSPVGAAIYNARDEVGFGVLTIVESTIDGNGDRGLTGNFETLNGGAIANDGQLNVVRSLILKNNAQNGGGIFNGSFGVLEVRESTITSNHSIDGGGISNFPFGQLLVHRSTITENTATNSGGGMFLAVDTVFANEIRNSIIAKNTGSGYLSGPNINVANLGPNSAFNYIGDLDNGDDPKLNALAENGGPTMTMSLKPGSPAWNLADPLFDLNTIVTACRVRA